MCWAQHQPSARMCCMCLVGRSILHGDTATRVCSERNVFLLKELHCSWGELALWMCMPTGCYCLWKLKSALHYRLANTVFAKWPIVQIYSSQTKPLKSQRSRDLGANAEAFRSKHAISQVLRDHFASDQITFHDKAGQPSFLFNLLQELNDLPLPLSELQSFYDYY